MEIQHVEPHSTDEPQSTGSPISRRTVVAVGVAAAWTIPLIQLATAAPASALGSVPNALFSTPLSGEYGPKPTRPAFAPLAIFGEVKIGGGVSSTQFTLSIVVPANRITGQPAILSGSTSWTPSGTPTKTGSTFTFMFTANLASGDIASLTGIKLDLKQDDLIGVGLITATVAYSGNPSLATSSNATAIPAAS